jgi:N-acyl-D-aspartate/D-glutamate deacylase
VRFIADAGMHSYMLTRWVRDTAPDSAHHVPLELMVKKLTSANAGLFGFADRGALLPGLRADLNLIDLGALATAAPSMVYDLPAGMPRLTEQVSGYVGTLVKGEFVTEQGAETGARPGRVLRGGQSAR